MFEEHLRPVEHEARLRDANANCGSVSPWFESTLLTAVSGKKAPSPTDCKQRTYKKVLRQPLDMEKPGN
jgi:hypothetical protein